MSDFKQGSRVVCVDTDTDWYRRKGEISGFSSNGYCSVEFDSNPNTNFKMRLDRLELISADDRYTEQESSQPYHLIAKASYDKWSIVESSNDPDELLDIVQKEPHRCTGEWKIVREVVIEIKEGA